MAEREGGSDKLLIRRAGPVAEVIINNPARHNALSLDMWEGLGTALSEIAGESNTRLLLVSGAGGKAFAAGADISRFESERATLEATRHYNGIAGAAMERLYNFPRPTIAKIQGYCIGGGLALALCCDLRMAASDATFAIPAARLGLGYGFAGVQRLAEVVGTAVAMEIFFTARRYGAEEALRVGLINQLLPPADLDAAVAATAARICENAPLTIAAVKAAVRQLGKPSASRDLAGVERLVEACFTSSDYAEGRRAFMEKRPPRFTGS
jgi:enoyl-CoA hydratase